MINYTLSITRWIDNPKYNEEMESYKAIVKERNEYRRNHPYDNSDEPELKVPWPTLEEKSLNVVLTEEQFNIIRENVMKEWK